MKLKPEEDAAQRRIDDYADERFSDHIVTDQALHVGTSFRFFPMIDIPSIKRILYAQHRFHVCWGAQLLGIASGVPFDEQALQQP
jgi:hypothetical protein